jgi:hypothetical protein
MDEGAVMRVEERGGVRVLFRFTRMCREGREGAGAAGLSL